MFLELNSFSFMGFPDSLEKDLHAMECNFLSRPTWEIQGVCKVAPSDEVKDEIHGKKQRVVEFCHDKKQEKEDRSWVLVSSLKVKLPEAREVPVRVDDEEEEEEEEKEEEEGCTTPTSVDHKILQVCPPAPRKPKSVPSTSRKGSRRRVLLDLSNEIESLFPPALLADFGKKIKKVRKEI